jgi:hypothetical protein
MVLRVDEDAADLADDPMIGQRLGPARVDLEFRRFRRKREMRRRDSDDAGKGKL